MMSRCWNSQLFLITRTAKKLIAALDSVKSLFACKICSMAALKSAKEWMITAAEGAAIHEIPEPFDGLVERISDSVPLWYSTIFHANR